jgi:hypothetical protein
MVSSLRKTGMWHPGKARCYPQFTVYHSRTGPDLADSDKKNAA